MLTAAPKIYRLSLPITVEPEPPVNDGWTWFDWLLVIGGGLAVAGGLRWYLS